jgi:hypothetical protein
MTQPGVSGLTMTNWTRTLFNVARALLPAAPGLIPALVLMLVDIERQA